MILLYLGGGQHDVLRTFFRISEKNDMYGLYGVSFFSSIHVSYIVFFCCDSLVYIIYDTFM